MLKSLIAEFDRSPYARSLLSWAQAGQLLVSLLAAVGFIAAALLGGGEGALMAALVGVIWLWFLGSVARAVSIILSPAFVDFAISVCPDGRALRCDACGYDLRGTRCADCPECGAAVIGHVPTPDTLSRPREKARQWCAVRSSMQSIQRAPTTSKSASS